METIRRIEDQPGWKQPVPATRQAFRVFAGKTTEGRTWEEIRSIADEAAEAHDLAKLGVDAPPS